MPRKRLRTLFLTGVAVLVPLAVSVWVLVALVGFAESRLSPVGAVLREAGIESGPTVVLLQFGSLLLVGLLTLVVGAVVQVRLGRRVVDRMDAYLASVPGLGVVYQTARRMSDMLLAPSEGDEAAQFREVKLVEFPGAETYTLGFLTRETPPDAVVETARTLHGDPDGEYRTLFLPMAPNPFMGGHLTHVPANRVHDVDVDVEVAIQYILTTGVVDASSGP